MQRAANANATGRASSRRTRRTSTNLTFLTFYILVPEKMRTLGYLNHNSMIYESNKVFSLLKYIGFYTFNFYSLILPPDGKMMDPYFRENESSEASGTYFKIY